MTTWKAIDTAPMDGTKILLCHEGSYGPFSGGYDRGKWTDSADGLEVRPTHWQPLPEAPTDDEAKQTIDFRSVGFTRHAADFPRDDLGCVLLAAFNNVAPEQLTNAMRYYPNGATKAAWQRVAAVVSEPLAALDAVVQWHARRAAEDDTPLAPEHQDEEIVEAMRVLAKFKGQASLAYAAKAKKERTA